MNCRTAHPHDAAVGPFRQQPLGNEFFAAEPDHHDLDAEIRIQREVLQGADRHDCQRRIDRDAAAVIVRQADDVVDNIDEACDLLELYGVDSPAKPALYQCRILVSATEHLAGALADLRGRRNIQQQLVELKAMEDEGVGAPAIVVIGNVVDVAGQA